MFTQTLRLRLHPYPPPPPPPQLSPPSVASVHPTRLIDALLKCGRIKGLTPLLPTVLSDLNRTRADLHEALWCVLCSMRHVERHRNTAVNELPVICLRHENCFHIFIYIKIYNQKTHPPPPQKKYTAVNATCMIFVWLMMTFNVKGEVHFKLKVITYLINYCVWCLEKWHLPLLIPFWYLAWTNKHTTPMFNVSKLEINRHLL